MLSDEIILLGVEFKVYFCVKKLICHNLLCVLIMFYVRNLLLCFCFHREHYNGKICIHDIENYFLSYFSLTLSQEDSFFGLVR